MNIYAPNDPLSRRGLWAEILEVKNSLEGMWVLMGDFNEVRDAGERLNSDFIEANADAFNHFILSAGLVEYNMGGGNFTYISDNGEKLSKLDRFLVCVGFREKWPNATVLALDRVASDHRPIVLCTAQSDFGHIPFRFFNSWFELPGFLDFVLQRCRVFTFSGPEDLAMAIKLRWLKNKIKEWLKVDKENKEGMYDSKKRRLAIIENQAEERMLVEEELDERAECRNFMAEFERLKQLDLRQKSRSKWAIDGDENSAFFHNIINSNISTNRLNGLMVDGVWITDPLVIKESLFGFFRQQFSEPMDARPELVCPNLATISDSDAMMLESPFTVDEIKTAVWDCDGDRAPGPDGFNFKFIKRCWDVFRDDLVKLFGKFYEEGSLNSCCTSSFIALIPKVKDPTSPKDFRPISLIGVINKVISKVLVNRLKGVVGGLISEQQSAFLAGRNIMDGPLILNEVLSWLKKAKRSAMYFKADLNKAYDSVNWAFLDSIMSQMKFPNRWRAWIMATLRTARASVLVNGSPTREFECTRGLRQGDPLSPFLFVIVMEALTGIMKKATSAGLFNGIKVTNEGPYLSHLIYADDVVFIGEWSIVNVNNLRRILRCFYLASGLKVNLDKCSIYGVGVNEGEVEAMAQVLKCRKGTFPFKHLGLLVGANMNLARNWKPVIDTFKNRLSLWKAKTLSYGGRITLIKSVLNALPTYYLSLFKAPVKVIDALDRILVGNGNNTEFWLDSWIDPEPLYIKYPALFKEEQVKNCLVSDRWSITGGYPVWIWAWSRPVLGPDAAVQFQQLPALLRNVTLSAAADYWKWRYEDAGVFSVAGIKKLLSSAGRGSPGDAFEWNNWVPKKVSIVAWRAEMERLPTKCALARRNVPVQDQMCVFCGEYGESSDHVFVSCHFAQMVWLNLAGWFKLQPVITFGIKDLLILHDLSSGLRKKKAIHAVVLVAFWCIWKLRNEIVFRQAAPNLIRTLDEIKSVAYLWIKNRAKAPTLTWEDWSRFNLGRL
ncbi:putative RNA-directed DNA polymerase [Helianthus annuus]|nr:putative RNA-directed DNA polymerase [Helianthus annuus]